MPHLGILTHCSQTLDQAGKTCQDQKHSSLLATRPRGSLGPRYVLQLLFSEKHKIANHSTITETREKNKHMFGIPLILMRI